LQSRQQEHLARQAGTLTLAIADRQRSQALAGIEKDATIDEATHRAALGSAGGMGDGTPFPFDSLTFDEFKTA
jgi:hypothetical protein